MTIRWTERAQDDLAAIHAFIEADSLHYARVIVRRLVHGVDRLYDFPLSGRIVPEYSHPGIREVVLAPYRVIYRMVSADEIHVLTVHHGARGAINVLP